MVAHIFGDGTAGKGHDNKVFCILDKLEGMTRGGNVDGSCRAFHPPEITERPPTNGHGVVLFVVACKKNGSVCEERKRIFGKIGKHIEGSKLTVHGTRLIDI